jgi:hypothetical protein
MYARIPKEPSRQIEIAFLGIDSKDSRAIFPEQYFKNICRRGKAHFQALFTKAQRIGRFFCSLL